MNAGRATVAVLLIGGLLHFAAPVTAPASQAVGGAVTVGVTVGKRVSATIPAPGSPASLLSNTRYAQSGEWVERDGERVWLVTVVPVD